MDTKRRIMSTPHPFTIGLQPKLWLDASDENTITLNGSNASAWADKSGNGNDLSQTNSLFQPDYTGTLNSKKVLTFDGINDIIERLSFGVDWNNTDFTIFIVSKLDSGATGFRGILTNRIGGATWFTIGNHSSNIISLETGNSPVARVDSSFSPAGQPAFITTVRKQGTTGEIAIDDGSFTSNTISSVVGGTGNGLRVGTWFSSSQIWKGQVAEIIIYLEKLSTLQVEKVRSYLKNKWGI